MEEDGAAWPTQPYYLLPYLLLSKDLALATRWWSCANRSCCRCLYSHWHCHRLILFEMYLHRYLIKPSLIEYQIRVIVKRGVVIDFHLLGSYLSFAKDPEIEPVWAACSPAYHTP